MASFIIEGGHRLKGEITPQGAKNEVLQIVCATLLTEEKVIVNNVPDILDVNNLITMLSAMGVEVERLGKGRFSFRAAHLNESYLQSDEFLKLCSSLRGSVMLMGPLLARLGRVLISKPGGDKIGPQLCFPDGSSSALYPHLAPSTESGSKQVLSKYIC